jgi:hypothetical protein
MTLSRWIIMLSILVLVSSFIAAFIATTDVQIVSGENGFSYLCSQNGISGSKIWIWTIVTILFLWLTVSLGSYLTGAKPASIVFEADSRSYLVFLFLGLDWFRFFPLFDGLIPSGNHTAVLYHRAITGLIFIWLFVRAKVRQRRAILDGATRQHRDLFSLCWIAILTVPLVWLPSILLTSGFKSHNTSPCTIKSQIRCLSLKNWMREQHLIFEFHSDDTMFLPRGTYKVRFEDNYGSGILTSPALMKSIPVSRQESTFHLPLPSRQITLHAPAGPDGFRRLHLTPVKADRLPESWKSWVPGGLDSRFHELPIPEPIYGHLYRLDTATYPLEPQGFWVQGKATSRFLIMSGNPVHFMEIGLRSIVKNTIQMTQGSHSFVIELNPHEERLLSFNPIHLPGEFPPYLYGFEVETQSGQLPSKLDTGNPDRRNLGVFLRFTNNRIEPNWLALANDIRTPDGSTAADLLASLRTPDIEPWVMFMRYLENQTGSDSRDILNQIIVQQPDSLDPLLEALPSTASPALKQAICNRIKAGLILRQSSWLADEAKRTGIAGSFDCHKIKHLPIKPLFSSIIQLNGIHCSYVPENRMLTIELLMQANRKPDCDYRIFLHVVPEGETLAGKLLRKLFDKATRRVTAVVHDQYPVNGNLMTSTWNPGLRLWESFPIQLPDVLESGTYEVRAGFYDPVSGKRLKSATGDSYFVVGHLEVQESS